MSTPRLVRFGGFEFDFASGELRSSGRRVLLQSQPAQVLAQLLSAPGQVVTREELRRTIWTDDTFVEFDAALNVAINKVRQALGDSATAPRFVETLPKRGYRFLADVHPVAPPDPPPPSPSDRPLGRPLLSGRWLWIAILAMSATLAAMWDGSRARPSTEAIRSVAVLPFRPLVAESRDDALEVGLAEAVIIRLGQFKQLRVPSIHAVRRYARSQPDPRVAGRDLSVETVLDGSLLRANGNIRLSARLLDVATGTTLWARQWDLPWTDIFTVQDAMASEVTRALAVSLAAGDRHSHRGHPTNVAAYEAYLRARHLLARRTVVDSRRAAELLEDAVRLDPESAAAYASLGFAYLSVPLHEGPVTPFVELGRQAAQRALDLDPANGEAHALLGRIKIHFDWDAEASDRHMRRALELEPTNPFVLHCDSLVLADDGRFEEALALADRALAQDPASVLANRDRGLILYVSRRYEDAVEQLQKTLELDPYTVFGHYMLGRAYEQLNRQGQALEAYLAALTVSERHRDTVARLRGEADREGVRRFWEWRLASLLEDTEVRPYSIALAYVRLGDDERALEWLERLYVERGAWLRGLKANPDWDPLRANPRFQDLLRRARMTQVPVPQLSRQQVPSRTISAPPAALNGR